MMKGVYIFLEPDFINFLCNLLAELFVKFIYLDQ
jgi:hypothetical protein